jgi:hypothetical protein
MMPLGHIGIPLLFPILNRNLDMDIRFLIVGAMLSDIIDKPLGHLLLAENNGRIFAHTLLFLAVLTIAGMAFRPLHSLSVGVGMHLLVDGIFMEPRTALWPLLGPFESYDFEVYAWIEAFTEPYVILEEITGLVLVVIFVVGYRLYRLDMIKILIRKGKLSSLQNHLYKKDMK